LIVIVGFADAPLLPLAQPASISDVAHIATNNGVEWFRIFMA
jgi:hypothetical protein